MPLHPFRELVDGQDGFANELSERALRDLAVIRDYEAPVRRDAMAQDDVATALPVDFVSLRPFRRLGFFEPEGRGFKSLPARQFFSAVARLTAVSVDDSGLIGACRVPGVPPGAPQRARSVPVSFALACQRRSSSSASRGSPPSSRFFIERQ